MRSATPLSFSPRHPFMDAHPLLSLSPDGWQRAAACCGQANYLHNNDLPLNHMILYLSASNYSWHQHADYADTIRTRWRKLTHEPTRAQHVPRNGAGMFVVHCWCACSRPQDMHVQNTKHVCRFPHLLIACFICCCFFFLLLKTSACQAPAAIPRCLILHLW